MSEPDYESLFNEVQKENDKLKKEIEILECRLMKWQRGYNTVTRVYFMNRCKDEHI